ncbi:MAG: hypothetical protein LC624_05140 [Halobacteriales archaeon]|nr:hypothetical protein [Halobacteriales archaeon]
MAKKARDEPPPLEAGLKGPDYGPIADPGEEPDEYLLIKIVEANGEHLKTMRWCLGIGVVLLVLSPVVGPIYGFTAMLALNLAAGLSFAIGFHALARQLELLRRAVAATDYYVFGEQSEHEQ